MTPIVGLVLGGLVATCIFLRFLLSATQDAKEPPAILTGIPFVQPLIGMIREKSRFYIRLRFVHSLQKRGELGPDTAQGTPPSSPSTPSACRSSASMSSTPLS